MLQPRMNAQVLALANNIYVFGGLTDCFGSPNPNPWAEVYHPTSNKWTPLLVHGDDLLQHLKPKPEDGSYDLFDDFLVVKSGQHKIILSSPRLCSSFVYNVKERGLKAMSKSLPLDSYFLNSAPSLILCSVYGHDCSYGELVRSDFSSCPVDATRSSCRDHSLFPSIRPFDFEDPYPPFRAYPFRANGLSLSPQDEADPGHIANHLHVLYIDHPRSRSDRNVLTYTTVRPKNHHVPYSTNLISSSESTHCSLCPKTWLLLGTPILLSGQLKETKQVEGADLGEI